MSLRGGFSRTLARPQFRELSPFEFTDVTGGRSSVGNPDLKRTLITNYDVRYEWFLTPTDLVALSVFHKDLDDPIEIVVQAQTTLITSYRNADKARNTGLEIEFRKNIGDWWERFKNLSVNMNYTFVRSRVKIGEQNRSLLTRTERPLVGQAENIFNLVLDYGLPSIAAEARALFNYTGERISDVGSLGLPDIIEHGYPNLDLLFAKHLGSENRWRVEFSVENLLDRQVDYRLDNQAFNVYRYGRKYEFKVSYKIF
jgi:TonB-dependent receptor